VHPDHLEELILHYERAGHPNELIQLMEQGLGQEGAHSGVFTELGVLYSKYMPSKLMEHIKVCNTNIFVLQNIRLGTLHTAGMYLTKMLRVHRSFGPECTYRNC
jgi:clathrin heavy chain